MDSCVITAFAFVLIETVRSTAQPVLELARELPDPALPIKTDAMEVQQIIVELHNAVRRTVNATGMLKVSWDDELFTKAKEWASTCEHRHPTNTEAERNKFLKTSKFSLGQNIAWMQLQQSWNLTFDMWFNEGWNFQLGKATDQFVGPYTQLVWNTTYLIGCAAQACNVDQYSMYTLYVCNYAPGGNIMPNEFSPYESGTPCSNCKNNCDDGLCTNPCTFTNTYSNCEVPFNQSTPLFPKGMGCKKPPSYLEPYRQSCLATCECGRAKIYEHLNF